MKFLKTLAFLLLFTFPINAWAAIAYDAAQGKANGNSSTPALTVVGISGNLLVISLLAEASGTTVSSITYASVAMTQLNTYVNSGDGQQSFSIWYLVNPASSGSVSVSMSGSTPWAIWGDSYSGVDTTTPFYSDTNGTGALGTPLDITRTSTSNGSWHFTSAKVDTAATALTISAGGTRRQVGNAGTVTQAQFDSNATVANTVSNTMTLNWEGGSQKMAYITAMMTAGAVVTTGVPQSLIMLSDD